MPSLGAMDMTVPVRIEVGCREMMLHKLPIDAPVVDLHRPTDDIGDEFHL